MKVMHLSHTDIKSDSRIIKELESVSSEFNDISVLGVGIFSDEKNASYINNKINLISINLFFKKIQFLPNFLRYFLLYCELFAKILKEIFYFRPNIIHCHDVYILPFGLICKFMYKSKLIYDAHELESKKNGIGKYQSYIVSFVEKSIWNFIDHLIVVSPSIENWYLKNYGFVNSEVILNSPSYSNCDTNINNSYLRNKYNISPQHKIFIYVGVLGEGRCIDLLVDVFKDIEDAHVVFMGYGVKENNLKILSLDYNNIHFHSKVSHEKVVSIINSADYGLCLIENISMSDYYCLPNKLFEYAFANVPILASDFPDIRNVVLDYNLGCVTKIDKISIHSNIVKMRDSVIKFNKNNLIDSFSWNRQSQKLCSIYKRYLYDN